MIKYLDLKKMTKVLLNGYSVNCAYHSLKVIINDIVKEQTNFNPNAKKVEKFYIWNKKQVPKMSPI